MNGPREGDAYQKRFSTVWTDGAGEAGSHDFRSLDMVDDIENSLSPGQMTVICRNLQQPDVDGFPYWTLQPAGIE